MQKIFGPVPSRRLGRSIGVNNIPPKVCSYSCVYCQLGRAIEMTAERRAFFDPEELVDEAGKRIEETRRQGGAIDYLTIVPDGEPTLDINLGKLIEGLKRFGIPVALITNSSLMGDPALREELSSLDWVSVKVDAVDEAVWRKIDRPHKSLQFKRMLTGIQTFTESFDGIFTTETMLVEGLNDSREHLDETAQYLESLEPSIAYVSIPTRPPAESRVRPSSEETIAYAYSSLQSRVARVENLIGYEGNEFNASGDARSDLLSIIAVHPMRRDAVEELLEKDSADVEVLNELVRSKELIEVEFGGRAYYVRGFRR